jgi:hypothetical protein
MRSWYITRVRDILLQFFIPFLWHGRLPFMWIRTTILQSFFGWLFNNNTFLVKTNKFEGLKTTQGFFFFFYLPPPNFVMYLPIVANQPNRPFVHKRKEPNLDTRVLWNWNRPPPSFFLVLRAHQLRSGLSPSLVIRTSNVLHDGSPHFVICAGCCTMCSTLLAFKFCDFFPYIVANWSN